MKLPASSADYDAWLIDLDGTLYAAAPVKAAMAVELAFAGPQVVRIIQRFRKEHDEVRHLDELQRPSPFDEQIARTARALSIDEAKVREVVEAWMIKRPSKWLHLFKRRWLIRAIQNFRHRGGLTALVSDYPAHEKLQAMYARTLFDEVVASGEPDGPSKLKPSPEGFLKAAQMLAVSPERCLVLGDREDVDGKAAEAAGMDFHLVT